MWKRGLFLVVSQSAGCKSKQNVATGAGCNLNWLQVKMVVSRGTTVYPTVFNHFIYLVHFYC